MKFTTEELRSIMNALIFYRQQYPWGEDYKKELKSIEDNIRTLMTAKEEPQDANGTNGINQTNIQL